MSEIRVKNLTINPIRIVDKNTKLLSILLQHADIMHACGGKGRCTTCKVRLLSGDLTPDVFTPSELKFNQQGRLLEGERLSCQVGCDSDVEIEIPDGSKLPHVDYVY